MLSKIVALVVMFALLYDTSIYAAEDVNIYHNTIEAYGDYYYVIKSDGTLYKIQHYDTDKSYENGDSSDNFIAANDMVPQKIDGGAISIASDYVLKADNSVWKIDKKDNRFSKITDDVREISSTGGHSLFVKNDNTLWGVGDNKRGELAQGDMSKSLEEQIAEGLRHKNKTICTPEQFDEPVMIMSDVQSAVTCGTWNIVLKTDGTVWTFGYDYVGQLGIGVRYVVNNTPTQILSDIKRIFASGDACFALDYDNTLWRWGSNYTGYAGGEGVLKPQKYIENASYVTNLPSYNLVVKTDNSLWLYGDGETDGGDISKESFKIMDNVIAVRGLYCDVGEIDRAIVLKSDGSLMLLTLPWDNFDNLNKVVSLEKLMYNVRLPESKVDVRNFTDIMNISEDIQQSINFLTKANIISGTSDTEFSPDKPITRAEISALLLRMTAKNDESGNGGFSDVVADQWYYNVAGASKKHGIVFGYEDNTFRGDENISKIQLVSLAARTLASERDYSYTVNEKLIVPEWAREDVSLAISAGLVDKNESFDGNITRGEAAVILYRLYGLI